MRHTPANVSLSLLFLVSNQRKQTSIKIVTFPFPLFGYIQNAAKICGAGLAGTMRFIGC
jgi:hypothetical protein